VELEELEFAAICVNSGGVCNQWHRTLVLKLFAKYNKNCQNVNSKRLQLTTVYFLTLNSHLAIFDFDI
jgi:hypothetical protein